MHYMKRRSLISNYYYWKPLKNIVSIKITLTCFGKKYFLRIFADKRLWVSNISVVKICKFLWCIETDLFKKWKKKQVLLLTCEVYTYIINHCTWHSLLSILMVSLKSLETKKRFLPVFPFMRLSWSHIKIIDNYCSKLLTINPVFLSSLYRIIIRIICIMKVLKEVKQVAYENFEQQRP